MNPFISRPSSITISTEAPMISELRGALQWRFPLWSRKAPGKRGGVGFLLFPAVFFLPLESVGVFDSRVQAISGLVWLLSISLALSIRTAAELRDPISIWHHQKGVSLGDSALEDWILDLAVFTGFSLWWASTGVAALSFTEAVSPRNLLALWVLGVSAAVLTHSVTFFLSAFGAPRTSDPVALFAFLSVLLPALSMNAPAWVFPTADWIIPPFRSTMVLSGAIRVGNLPDLTGSLFHVLSCSGLALWLGFLRISRWRPLL